MGDFKPILLVGSIPGDSAGEVFHACGPALGDKVMAVPDGETGNRRIWVTYLAATLLDPHPEISALNRPKPVGSIENEWRTPEEDWVPSSFDDLWFFAVNEGVESLSFEKTGYADCAIASFKDFKKAKASGAIAEDTRFQVCLPLAESALRWFIADKRSYDIVKPAYEDALRKDIARIVTEIPSEELAIQWDVCMEVVAAALNDFTEQPPLAYRLEKTPIERWLHALKEFSVLIPSEIPLGLHLCYGDLGHKHMVEPVDLTLSVEMANLGSANAGRKIDYVHMAVPRDRSDDAYFQPLLALDIGETVPYLGLVHHTDGAVGTRARIASAKQYLSKFGIATECGFGRRPAEQIPELLEIHREMLGAI